MSGFSGFTYIIPIIVIVGAIYALLLLLFLGLGRSAAIEDEEMYRRYRELRDGGE